MSARVRPAEPADLDVLTPLFEAYRAFYAMKADRAAAAAFLAARLARGDSRVFVAFHDDGRAVGFTQLYPSFSSTLLGPLWILNDLYVEPEARRTGAGNALMAAAEAFARDDGAVGIMLSTAHDNHTAQRVYVARGYVHDAAFRDYVKYF